MATFTTNICPKPFLMAEMYGNATVGCEYLSSCASPISAHRSCLSVVLPGRMCQEFAGIHCCLPCPKTDWLYPDNFNTITDAANWINVAGIVCTVFLLITWAVLPVEKTHRHYLSICLAIGVVFMQVCCGLTHAYRSY
jgi:hypothetical protein